MALALAFLLSGVGADEFEFLKAQEQNRARDFASQLYLQNGCKDITRCRIIFYTMKSPKITALNAFAKAIDSKPLNALLACKNASFAKEGVSPECAAIAINAQQASALDRARLLQLAKSIVAIDPNKARWLSALASNDPLGAAADDPNTFYSIALGVLAETLKRLPMDNLNITELENDVRFSRLVERVALIDVPQKTIDFILTANVNKLDNKGAFYIGILFVMQKRFNEAFNAFEIAAKKAPNRYSIDRALFWQWLIRSDKQALERLANSAEINFYSIFAREVDGKKPLSAITAADAPKGAKADYTRKELFDPFFWSNLRKRIYDGDRDWLLRELNKLAHVDAEGYRAAILYALLPSENTNIFLYPYQNALANLSVDERAVTLAIMRQESHFVPASLSSSYAIGAMQMMPFLIETMTKANKDRSDPRRFFDPYVQMPYATKHISWLRGKLSHPLFVFYAYNGGYGFTSRMLDRKQHFRSGEFEPFLSMERVPIEETREYGKSVLANYVVYKRLFGEPITLRSLLKSSTLQSD